MNHRTTPPNRPLNTYALFFSASIRRIHATSLVTIDGDWNSSEGSEFEIAAGQDASDGLPAIEP